MNTSLRKRGYSSELGKHLQIYATKITRNKRKEGKKGRGVPFVVIMENITEFRRHEELRLVAQHFGRTYLTTRSLIEASTEEQKRQKDFKYTYLAFSGKYEFPTVW